MAETVARVDLGALPAPGDFRRVSVRGRSLVVCSARDGVFVADDRCTHDGGSLAGGRLVGEHVLECPRHLARFDVRNGQPCGGPAVEPIRTYPARVVEGGVIEITLPNRMASASPRELTEKFALELMFGSSAAVVKFFAPGMSKQAGPALAKPVQAASFNITEQASDRFRVTFPGREERRFDLRWEEVDGDWRIVELTEAET